MTKKPFWPKAIGISKLEEIWLKVPEIVMCITAVMFLCGFLKQAVYVLIVSMVAYGILLNVSIWFKVPAMQRHWKEKEEQEKVLRRSW